MSTRMTDRPIFQAAAPNAFTQLWCLLCFVVFVAPGCAAFHPIRGVPAAYLPDQFEGPSRSNKRTIDLSMLVQTPPDQHRVAAGDVLSIYIPRVLGSRPTEVASVGIDPPINIPASVDDPPTVGFPIQVRDDNTISLPQIPPLNVGNLTLEEVENAIRRAYTVEHHILRPEEALVMVSLQRPRVHRVLVVRQETGGQLTGTSSGGQGTVNLGTTKKGTARTVTLKAYENDVLHALAIANGADGLPGLDAENTIYIIRRRAPHSFQPPPMQVPHIQPFNPAVPQHSFPQPHPEGMQSGELQQTPQARPRNVSSNGAPLPFNSYRSHPAPGGNFAGNAAAPQQAQQSPIMLAGYQAEPTEAPTPVPQLPQAAPSYPSPGNMPPPANFDGHSLGTLPAHTDGPPHSGFPPHLPSPTGAMPPPEGWTGEPGPQWASLLQGFDPTIDNPNVIKIPVRLAEGEVPCITQDQIKLYDGDIVFIESRETEVFYTGGLLGGGQYTLPRDYDLRVLEALSIAESRVSGGGSNLNRAMGGVSALNQDVANSASRMAILRTLPNGQRITIEVDLHKAMRYQEENILVQPGDMLILQYTIPEAVAAFTQRFLLEGALIGLATSFWTTGGGG